MRVWKASGTLDINKAMGRARRRMENRVIWTAVLFTVQFSGILCRNPYYEYYYSRYHKGHSTTEAISSSTSDNSYEEGLKSSVSDYTSLKGITGASSSTTDDTSLENGANSSTVDHGTSVHTNVPVLQYGERHKFHHIFIERIALVIGSIIAFLCIIGMIVCCCPKYCRGRERNDFVRRSEIETAREVRPQQPVLVPYPQQPVAQHFLPHYPDERTQQFPPQYQSQLIQQQYYQYSPGHPQFYNLPEPPPPYEPTPK